MSKSTDASTTSAAVVSVSTKFGQHRFTPVPSNFRKFTNSNRFFKTRSREPANGDGSEKGGNNTAQPKALLLNRSAKDDQSTYRSVTIGSRASNYGKSKSASVSQSQSSGSTKIISLSATKSCEIKVRGDETIKKVISPTKTTQFVIRSNATLKPVTTPSNVLPVTRAVRASRRLKGIEPEPVNNSVRRTQTIHVVYDKSSPSSKPNSSFDDIFAKETLPAKNNHSITTLIEEANDESAEEIQEDAENIAVNETAEAADADEKLEGKESDKEEKEESVEEEAKEEHQREEEEDQEKVDNETESSTLETVAEEQHQLSDKAFPQSEASSQAETLSQQSLFSDYALSSSQPLTDELADAKQENKAAPARPKKKIFSNRDRSKVEFNTKSFFASSLKDEFDMDLDDKQSTAAPASSVEKKNGHENEEDDQYIKLKRIKKAHQCHDLGETEQFDEDIKYYLSGIVATNNSSMRCLSILGLSQQAMRPEFRMHLRAHDDMPRIIKALMDAPQDSNLAICTATLMFVYNQDRLTMDIDPNALSLMLDLLETRSDECNRVEEKHRVKVEKLVEEMKNKGFAKYLKLTEVTAGKLAMETLLGLTSKRAGDWFKVELRKMKGIDFIVNTVLRCAENYAEEGQMIKIDRCMHVLENVTFNNVENQLYITSYNESKFISVCISLLENCKLKIISLDSNESKIFLSAFFSILRVLTNLTSESVDGCKVVGSFSGIMELLLESVFELPTFIMSDQRFDLMVIILCLCINLVEFCEHIREIVMTSEKYMNRLSEFLFKKIEEAAQVEQQTDHLLESHETVQMTEAMQDNLLMQMISKSGTHMEHSLLSACVCLLFGCCIQDNDDYMQTLKESLPNNSFDPLIEMLEKLRDFAHLADIMTQKGKDRVQRVLQIFKMYK